ncbi:MULTISPECIES: leucine-rich repeat domain-containing protein [Ralstonia solanacearum species complex]|uniref:leucine-rich repeat domain-containing protein n=1 Tax=Ralstonia solanacearum species complex TaxID=3116862 RepID=UPI0013C2F188|nr:leucine-rich repeat domain-containing protein [Ralstonia solanacearum]BEU73019.1 hypothetical protein MAFF211271_25740 [Ralstonia pseudosolanacearum]
MDHFKYVNVFDYGKFAEAYHRLAHPADDGERAGGTSAPQARDHGVPPRARQVAGALQGLQELRIADRAKSPQRDANHEGPGRARQEAGQTPHASDEPIKHDFDRWLKGGGLTAQRTQAATRMAKAAQEQAHALQLGGLNLGRLPAKLGKFSHLRELRIDGNRLSHFPAAVGYLHRLETLDAQGNQMTELPPAIGDLQSLKHLNVDANRLESFPNELSRLAQLETLSARSNRLTRLPAQMSLLKNLRTLDLSHNQLRDIPLILGNLFRLLQHVNLSNNRLQELPRSYEMPVEKMALNVSDNPMVTLPTSYGGFSYAKRHITAADDHLLKNAGGKVTVNTKGTMIRQGLVNEGRLAARRGIVADRHALHARGRPLPSPPPSSASDGEEIYSLFDHMREHAEPGEIVGLERLQQGGQAAPAVSSDWGARRLEAWVDPLAEQYATRHVVAPAPGPSMEEPLQAAWDSARADLCDWQRTASGPPTAPLRSSPAPQLRPDFLAALYADLARLPAPQATAIASYLNSMPQPTLLSVLAQLQNNAWNGMPVGTARADGGVPMFRAEQAPTRADDREAAWFAAAAPTSGHDRTV